MTTRKKIIIGNWKMNNGPKQAHDFLHELETLAKGKTIDVDFAIAAPFTSLPFMFPHSHGHDHSNFTLPLAAQNFFWEEKGAFTGEVSINMLDEMGVDFALVGHSERRTLFFETNKNINKKLHACLNTHIIPVFCFGETLQEFEDNKTTEVVTNQINEALEGIESDKVGKIIFAYEPVWAIGTGKTATSEYAQKIAHQVREIISKKYGNEIGEKIRIQYGGSVNTSNIKEILSQPDIDGALVGGASLKSQDFFKLITFDKE